MTKVDYLIVGQGLAGSVLGFLLTDMGKKVLIFDIGHPNVASQVAAGLMNPITGKRFVKGKDVDQALSFAYEFYRSLEKKLGVSFFEPIPIVRLLEEGEEIVVRERLKDFEYRKYLTSIQKSGVRGRYLKDEYGSVCIKGGAIVHLKQLLKRLEQYFLEKGVLKREVFDYQKLTVSDGIEYNSVKAKVCVFCEGVSVRANPWFGGMPFEYSKGEILTIQFLEDFLKRRVLIKDGSLIPVEKNIYRLGATYDWEHVDFEFSEMGEWELMSGLQNMVKLDEAEILKKEVGIRVNGKNRQPMIEQHAQYPALIVFNGFGSKGTLRIPLEAKRLVERLECLRIK